MRVYAFLEHWGLINFHFELKNHSFSGLSNPSSNGLYQLEAKCDNLVRERIEIDPDCDADNYFHTFASLTRRIRPTCDTCGFFCGSQWYRKDIGIQADLSTINKKLANSIILCKKCYESNNYPKIFHKDKFELVKFSTILEKNRQKCKKYLNLVNQFNAEEIKLLLEYLNSNKGAKPEEINWDFLFKKFPEKRKEDIVLKILSLPFEDITMINIFEGKNKKAAINASKRSAINSLVDQDPTCFFDYENPIMYHASLFKMFLDKAKGGKFFKNDKNKFKHQRSEEMDQGIEQLEEMSKEDAETIIELEEELKNNAKELREKEDKEMDELLSSVIDHQLHKLELKMNFIDEYEKAISHEHQLIEAKQNQILLDRYFINQLLMKERPAVN